MLDRDSMEKDRAPSRRVNVTALSLTLWLLLAGAIGYYWFNKGNAPPPPPSLAVSRKNSGEALAVIVAEKVAALGLPAKTVTTPAEQALAAASAIEREDFTDAGSISEGILSQSRLQGWSFYPFSDFMKSIVRTDDTKLLDGLNLWLKREPQSGLAHLIRAEYYRHAAWRARGSELGWMVPESLMQRFHDDLNLSAADVAESIRLNPKIPWSYYELLVTKTGEGDSAEVERVFQSDIKLFPGYYPLYKERLRVLSPKWGGSVDAMYEFVRKYAGAAPENSAIRLLYLDLYVQLLDLAAFDCRSFNGEARSMCVARDLPRMNRPDLAPGIESALKLYKVSDPNQFSWAVWPLLASISCNKCNGSSSGGAGVLQLAASIMGSDNQLMETHEHNSYMLDDITARVWAQSENPANADRKFQEALSDAEHTSFADPAQKARVEAEILDHMAAVADDHSQFIDILAYEDAANTVGGLNRGDAPYRKCYAYYRLKHFNEAAKECTALIHGNGDLLQTHYWLAKSYEGLRQWDASIAEFTPVAESADNWFRVGAALDMSYDYGQKGDFNGELAELNRYAYLFDSRMQSPHDLAVAFNNRCHARMKLGQLQDALDDCTQSLRFDRIPDALQKQQQLLQLLGKKIEPANTEPGSQHATGVRPGDLTT